MKETTMSEKLIFRYEDCIQDRELAILINHIKKETKLNVPENLAKYPWFDGDEIPFYKIAKSDSKVANAFAFCRDRITQMVAISYHEVVHSVYSDLVLWRPGRSQEEHTDDMNDDFRKYSAILYLNEGYEGGETFINTPQGTYISKPKAGTVIVFTGDDRCKHGVNQVVSGNRMTMAMWFADDIKHAEKYY